MSAIVVKAFNGLKPISNALLLDPSDAQVANNVVLNSGSLRPLKRPTILKALTKVGAKTIYRFDPDNNKDEAFYWMEWMQDTDVMRSPIAQDQWDRLYWTDVPRGPRYGPKETVTVGDTLPGVSYLLGVPEPTTAPTVTAFTEPIKVETVDRYYALSLYADIEFDPKSGPPGPPWKVQVMVEQEGVENKPVKFTGLTTDNRGDIRVTHKLMWRKVDLLWYLIASIPLAQTEYEDALTNAETVAKPQMPPVFANAPRAPQYPPAASAGALPSVKKIDRDYVYTITNFNFEGVDYTESATSTKVTVNCDEAQTVTLAGLYDPSFNADKFRVYRKDADKSGYLFVAEFPVSQTSYEDVVGDSRPSASLGKLDGPPSFVPTPATASVSGGGGGSTVKRVYMITYTNMSGNESPRSPESEVVMVVDGETEVVLYHGEPVPTDVVRKRLYRQDITESGGVIVADDANWKFVAENSASSTQAVDVIPTASLPGTPYVPTFQNIPPTPTGVPVTKAEVPASVVPESRVYVYTLVTKYDEEGAPSPSSEVISCDPAKSVTLTIPGGPGGQYNLTKKRIYRSATGTQRTKFQFVGEVPLATMSFVDDVRTSALGELLPSDGWIPPPVGLAGLRMMANGCAVGFVGNSLYFSEPNLPHAWPHEYPIDDVIVAIGTFGQSVVVLTNNYPYLFSGIDPAAMASTKLQLPQACSSKRSIVETGDGVLYASPDGMTMIGQSTSVVTLNVMSREIWQSYNPSTMEAFIHNGRVIVVYENPIRGILILDISGAGALLSTSDINDAQLNNPQITAGYYSPQRDILYFAHGENIVRFDHGTPLIAKWKSKLFRQGMQHNFGWGQVFCKTYGPNTTIRFFADGIEKYARGIVDGEPFRLPSGFRALDWEFEITTDREVTEVFMASSSAQLQMT